MMCKYYKHQLVFDAAARGLGFRFTARNCSVPGTDQGKFIPLPFDLDTTDLDEILLGEMIVQSCRNNMKIVCGSCPLKDTDQSEELIDRILIGMSYEQCNLKCTYCFNRHLRRHPVLFDHYGLLLKCIKALYMAGQLSGDLEFLFSSGEFSINPKQWELYKKLKELFTTARFSFHTNSTVLSDVISSELERGGTILTNIPHVDCEKYKYITLGQTPIDQVFENLSHYKDIIVQSGYPDHHLKLNLFASKLIDTSVIDQFIDKVHAYNLQACDIGLMPIYGELSLSTHLYNHVNSYFSNEFSSRK